jgi:hypothetical protein
LGALGRLTGSGELSIDRQSNAKIPHKKSTITVLKDTQISLSQQNRLELINASHLTLEAILLGAGYPVEFLHVCRISRMIPRVEVQFTNFTDILFFSSQLAHLLLAKLQESRITPIHSGGHYANPRRRFAQLRCFGPNPITIAN